MKLPYRIKCSGLNSCHPYIKKRVGDIGTIRLLVALMVGENVRKCSRSRSNCSCAFLSSRINLLAILRQQVVVTRLIIYESWRVVWQSVMGLRLFPALEHLVNPLGLFPPFHVKLNVLIVYQVSTYSVPLCSVSSWMYFKCTAKRYAHIWEGPRKRIAKASIF